MNNINDLKNKKLALLGLGIENQAFLRFLIKNKIECEITICDFRSKKMLGDRYIEFEKNENIDWKLGRSFNQQLGLYDILFRSPGWSIKCPGIREALKGNTKLSSPMQIFFDLCPTKNIIGVTGTKGKGTVSSLIYEIIKADKREVFLGGNIGVAPFEFFYDIKVDSYVVLELSSFHLEDMDASPHIAVLTNFTPEHLSAADPNNPNFHASLEKYWEAKSNVFRFQGEGDYLVVEQNQESRIKNQESRIKDQEYLGKTIVFSSSDIPSQLVGEHNKKNIAAAVEVGRILNINISVIEKAIKNFKGLPYRTEFIKEVDGVRYYNDSFATTPEATITGLKSFNEPIVLLAGGADKGSDFLELANEIKLRVKYIVLFKGAGSDKIKQELIKVNFKIDDIKEVGSMNEAFEVVKKQVVKGEVVLLSTACASFGVFKNYKERGSLFNEEVEKL